MKVVALRVWDDKLEGVRRKEGDVFEVTDERYAEICAYRSDLVAPYESSPAKPCGRRTARKTVGK